MWNLSWNIQNWIRFVQPFQDSHRQSRTSPCSKRSDSISISRCHLILKSLNRNEFCVIYFLCSFTIQKTLFGPKFKINSRSLLLHVQCIKEYIAQHTNNHFKIAGLSNFVFHMQFNWILQWIENDWTKQMRMNFNGRWIPIKHIEPFYSSSPDIQPTDSPQCSINPIFL